MQDLDCAVSGYGNGDGYGRGFVDGRGYGYGDGHGYSFIGGYGFSNYEEDDGNLHLLGTVDDYEVWCDPVFGVASIGCQTLTINEWRKQWEAIAHQEGLNVPEILAKGLLRLAESCMRWRYER